MLLLTLLAACGETDETTDTAPVDSAAELCTLSLSVSVLDGASGVPGNAAVEVTLSAPDDTATVTGSVPGETTRSDDGLSLTWSPVPPIDPLTDVTLTIQTCAGTSTIGYQTSDVGGPLDAGVDLGATGFRIDLAAGTIVQPTTGTALLSLLSDMGTEFLLGLSPAETGDTAAPGTGDLDFRFAVTTGGVQDTCSRTIDAVGGQLDRGWFSYGPGELSFFMYDNVIYLEALAFGGAVRADGSAIEAVWMSGWVRVEPLAAVYAEGDIDQACAFFSGLGAPCEPCPESGGQCLAIAFEDLTGVATGAPVQEVTETCPE